MGADFRVDYLLNLSVFRHPGRDSIGSIRVDAELIDARSEESESVGAFSGRLESGFEMHREIAQGIVQKLDLTLAAPEREALESNPTDNRLALEYLQEAHRVNRQGATRAINLRAAELARMAIAEDSSFALAYAELAVVLFAAGQEEDVRLGQEALARARALDPDLPQAQLPNGYFLYSQGHFEEAAEVWRERLQSRPSDPDVLHILGLVERRLGHWVESLELLERAVDLDPLNPLLLGNLAWTYLRVRDYENADTLLMRRATVFSANDPRAVASLAQSQAWLQLQHRGDIAGAERVLRQAVEEVGLEAVLGVLATNDVKYLWFSLPDWGFRKELRESSVEEVDAHPGNYYLARAVSEEAEGDTAGAEAYYDSVRVVMESQETLSATGHSGLGMAYAGLGRVEEAISEAEEGARMRSVSMDAVAGTWNLMYLARVLVMAGKHERAVEVLDSLMTLPSDWSRTWLDINPFFDPLRNRSDFQALIEGSQSG
jgi:tetratricopeptide (TPR) repeat protein